MVDGPGKEGNKETSYEEAAGDSGRNHIRVVAMELGDMRNYRQVPEMKPKGNNGLDVGDEKEKKKRKEPRKIW